MNTTLESQQTDLLLCCYRNPTHQVQIVRISNIENWYFERVVFPLQKLLFHAPPRAHLEVHSSELATALQVDSIPCNQLQVKSAS
ncbi:DUF1830 domain-containing protein [Acaryochloris marina]|uniref:DUF1830 domain-containing protein n=1 Tax=Acaryochloris marina TaxID=155978 RepID=UPI0008FFDFFE|nr:DUF1830 domain-containing protein [Acaryochloris marina]